LPRLGSQPAIETYDRNSYDEDQPMSGDVRDSQTVKLGVNHNTRLTSPPDGARSEFTCP